MPLLIAVAPSWAWIVAANVLLGVNQGLAWSMTVVMKIDLVGPRRRGLALGLNEAAGYGGVALAAGLSGWLAAAVRRRATCSSSPAPSIAVTAFLLSVLFVRDTAAHVALEQARHHAGADGAPPALRDAFAQRHLPRAGAALLLAGRAGQQPQRRASPGASSRCSSPRTARASAQIGLVAARLPRRLERRADRDRPLVRHGRPQAADRRRHAAPGRRARAARAQRRRRSRSRPRAAVLLGLGTALVYPTLIAAISDAVSPVARAPSRRRLPLLARHAATSLGGLIAGVVADALGYGGAIAHRRRR